MPLFHCTHRILQIGAIVMPGNWGDNIFAIGPNHRAWAREMALEAIRSWHFPAKPSRLKSTFACDNYETISCYKSAQCRDGFIYEVRIVDDGCAVHKGDFNAVQPLPGCPDGMMQIAYKYWMYELKTDVQGWEGVECSEIVTASALEVVHVCQ